MSQNTDTISLFCEPLAGLNDRDNTNNDYRVNDLSSMYGAGFRRNKKINYNVSSNGAKVHSFLYFKDEFPPDYFREFYEAAEKLLGYLQLEKTIDKYKYGGVRNINADKLIEDLYMITSNAYGLKAIPKGMMEKYNLIVGCMLNGDKKKKNIDFLKVFFTSRGEAIRSLCEYDRNMIYNIFI